MPDMVFLVVRNSMREMILVWVTGWGYRMYDWLNCILAWRLVEEEDTPMYRQWITSCVFAIQI